MGVAAPHVNTAEQCADAHRGTFSEPAPVFRLLRCGLYCWTANVAVDTPVGRATRAPGGAGAAIHSPVGRHVHAAGAKLHSPSKRVGVAPAPGEYTHPVAG